MSERSSRQPNCLPELRKSLDGTVVAFFHGLVSRDLKGVHAGREGWEGGE